MFEEYDGRVAVGSHDPKMIGCRRTSNEYDRDYEVQMLMGVRDDAQRELAAEGRKCGSTRRTVTSGSPTSIVASASARKTRCSPLRAVLS